LEHAHNDMGYNPMRSEVSASRRCLKSCVHDLLLEISNVFNAGTVQLEPKVKHMISLISEFSGFKPAAVEKYRYRNERYAFTCFMHMRAFIYSICNVYYR